jgi:hypothetical protein
VELPSTSYFSASNPGVTGEPSAIGEMPPRLFNNDASEKKMGSSVISALFPMSTLLLSKEELMGLNANSNNNNNH